MNRMRSTCQIGLYLIVGGVTTVLLSKSAAFAQETTRRGRGTELYPRFPGAMTRAPEGLGSTPFDLDKFFAAPPRDRNAAPLYLDAFFEFGDNVAACFPEGPDRTRRRQAAQDRLKSYLELDKALYENPKGVSPAKIEELIKLYDTGFRKIGEAQRRERCVFETGDGAGFMPPHVQAVRQVIRVCSLKIRRATEKRDFDGAIRDVASEFRLARDLQPRGGIMVQLVSTAITQVLCVQIPQIVVAPGAGPSTATAC